MRIQRQVDAFAYRIAALTQDIVDRLDEQFHDWYADGGVAHEDGGPDMRAQPLQNWRNIERFLKDNYPAAHRGLYTGMESAQPLLDQQKGMYGDPIPNRDPYETGPNAQVVYGYDPKEIAAGMLLLHNQSNPFRGEMAQVDQDRLNDIVQKRVKMQRDYEKRMTAANYSTSDFGMPGNSKATGPHQWKLIDHIPADVGWLTDPDPTPVRDIQPHTNKWYHASPVPLEPGQRITPPGQNTPSQAHPDWYGYGNENRRNYVWLSPNVDEAKQWGKDFSGQYIYEVHPGDTPQEYGLNKGEGWVAPGATVTRRIGMTASLSDDWDNYFTNMPIDPPDISVAPTTLHRGVGFGKGELPPELEQRVEAAKNGTHDPALAQDLITHMSRGGHGLGGFWAHGKDGPWLAEGYSRRTQHGPYDNNPADHSVVMSGDWDGNNHEWEWADDPDYRKLRPGAPLHVHTLRLHTPKGWIELGGDPEGVTRYARQRVRKIP